MDADNQNQTLSLGNLNFASRFTDGDDEFFHTHDYYEIFYICYGQIEHHIAQKKHLLTMSDAYLISPGIKHKFVRTGECTHRDIMISTKMFKTACDYLDEKLFDRIQTEKIVKFSIKTAQMVHFESSYNLYINSEILNDKYIYEKILCLQLLSILITNTQTESHPSTFQNKCSTFITEHLNQKDLIKLVCKNIGYTPGHFCKKFKIEFNMTPTDYINLKRINLAAEILTISTTPVEECCHQVGFDSLPYFINLFKKHYNATPAQYRRKRNSEKT